MAATVASALADKGPTARPGLLDKGKFLIAGRDLGDPSFYHTVVLLLEHSSEGSLGVIVNRPTEVTLSDLLPEVETLKERKDIVFAGGPVMPGYMLLLMRTAAGPKESRQVMDGVFYSMSRAALEEVVARGEKMNDLRVFAGHAGWSPGQLEWEVNRGGWHILSADTASIFDEKPAELWPHLIERTNGLLAEGGPAAGSARRATRPASPAAARLTEMSPTRSWCCLTRSRR